MAINAFNIVASSSSSRREWGEGREREREREKKREWVRQRWLWFANECGNDNDDHLQLVCVHRHQPAILISTQTNKTTFRIREDLRLLGHLHAGCDCACRREEEAGAESEECSVNGKESTRVVVSVCVCPASMPHTLCSPHHPTPPHPSPLSIQANPFHCLLAIGFLISNLLQV